MLSKLPIAPESQCAWYSQIDLCRAELIKARSLMAKKATRIINDRRFLLKMKYREGMVMPPASVFSPSPPSEDDEQPAVTKSDITDEALSNRTLANGPVQSALPTALRSTTEPPGMNQAIEKVPPPLLLTRRSGVTVISVDEENGRALFDDSKQDCCAYPHKTTLRTEETSPNSSQKAGGDNAEAMVTSCLPADYVHYDCKFTYFIVGEKAESSKAPEDGRPLFIGMHGGGGCPPEINDSQWRGHEHLYDSFLPIGSIWVTPRAPTNEWNLWWLDYMDAMVDTIVKCFVSTGFADPTRVYLTGYSAGGDGAYQLGQRIADRLAGVVACAGHPNGAPLENMRNTYAVFMCGGKDAAYGRNAVTCQYLEKMRTLQILEEKRVSAELAEFPRLVAFAESSSQVTIGIAGNKRGSDDTFWGATEEKAPSVEQLRLSNTPYAFDGAVLPAFGHWMGKAEGAFFAPMASRYRRRSPPRTVVWRPTELHISNAHTTQQNGRRFEWLAIPKNCVVERPSDLVLRASIMSLAGDPTITIRITVFTEASLFDLLDDSRHDLASQILVETSPVIDNSSCPDCSSVQKKHPPRLGGLTIFLSPFVPEIGDCMRPITIIWEEVERQADKNKEEGQAREESSHHQNQEDKAKEEAGEGIVDATDSNIRGLALARKVSVFHIAQTNEGAVDKSLLTRSAFEALEESSVFVRSATITLLH